MKAWLGETYNLKPLDVRRHHDSKSAPRLPLWAGHRGEAHMLEVVSLPAVYLVDDDPVVLAFIEAVLSPQGYLVERFSGGAGVLAKAATAPPSLFVLDVRMPDVDGIELLERLRSIETCAATPVLMLTGSGRLDRIALAMQAGATDFLMKPFTPEQIMAKVRMMIQPSPASSHPL